MQPDLDEQLDDLELRKRLGIHPAWREPDSGRAVAPGPGAAPNLATLPGPPPAGPIPGPAAARAAKLAADARAIDLARAAGDPGASRETVRLLLAHQLAAGHSLMMRLAAIADSYIDYVQPAALRDPYLSRCPTEAVRLTNGAARLMERYRAGALALDRLGYPGEAEVARVGDRNSSGGDNPEDKPPGAPARQRVPPRAGESVLPAAIAARRGRLNNGNPSGDFLCAPRCGAATRAGHACRQPAMANGRCRLHGGKSTGPRTAAGLERSRAARLVHGFRSGRLIALRSATAQTARELKQLTRVAQASAPQEGFTTKSQRARSERVSRAYEIDGRDTPDSCAAFGRAKIPFRHRSDSAVVPRPGRFASFVTLWCNPSSFPAGHGVHRSNFSPPLGTPVQSRGAPAKRCGPFPGACP